MTTTGRRPCRSSGRSARGFTLIELLIAVSLMAVLAVLCWRGLDSVVRARDTITASSDELRALTVTFTQLEDDLRRSWSARLFKLPRPSIDFMLDNNSASASNNSQIALDLLSETGPNPNGTRLQRVIYRVREGQLERGFAPWSLPSSDAMTAVEQQPVFIWQPLLTRVASVSMRAWMESGGAATVNPGSAVAATGGAAAAQAAAGIGTPTAAAWYDALALLPPPGGANPPTRLITGLEFMLARVNGGRIVREFAIRE